MRTVPLISIVDDDESICQAMRGLVRSLGYDAATFQSADDFLRSEARADTACVISDIHMPGLSGFDLQDRLAGDDCSIPIIFITAFPSKRAQAKALAAGAIGFLQKPFDDEALIACLESAVVDDRQEGHG